MRAFASPPRRQTTTAAEVKQKPHGGKLVDLMVEGAAAEAAMARTTETLQLSDRQLCDVELIINGGFSPLTGFMVRAMRRLSGTGVDLC
jgi:ATP sulfurylase